MSENKSLQRKASGFYLTCGASGAALIGLISFFLLTTKGFESTELPTVVIGSAVATVLFGVLTAWRDLLRVFSLLNFVLATITFFAFLSGRISYLAFYFSGDIMGTGLSPFFLLSAIAFLAALVLSAMALYFPQEKEMSK